MTRGGEATVLSDRVAKGWILRGDYFFSFLFFTDESCQYGDLFSDVAIEALDPTFLCYDYTARILIFLHSRESN